MKKTYLTTLLVASVIALGAQCCDPKHDGYILAQENIKSCNAKGGIPITTPVVDEGQHTFQLLTSCAFPCDQRLVVEK